MTQSYDKPDPRWLLADAVSIVEAALLVLEIEPQGQSENVELAAEIMQPNGYVPTRDAILRAIEEEKVRGKLVAGEHRIGNKKYDLYASTVEVHSLQTWLLGKGHVSDFLSPRDAHCSDFQNPHHPRYAKKLAAAVEAWEQYDEDSTKSGRPKQRMVFWLRSNASRLDLVNDAGDVNETAIQSIAKIANWETKGGAPKSSGQEPDPD